MRTSTKKRAGQTAAVIAALVAAVAATAVSPPTPAAATPGPLPCVRFGSDIFVSDAGAFGPDNGGLIRVESVTGTRSTLSESNDPVGGPAFDTPSGMAFAADGSIVVAEGNATGATTEAVVRVNLATGARTLVSDNTTPAGGPSFVQPSGIAIEADGAILVADLGGSVIRVDPATGARTLVSDNSAPLGDPSFHSLWDLAVASNGDIFVVDHNITAAGAHVGKVIRVDPQTGVRTLVSKNTNPVGGPDFVWPWGATLDPNGDILVSDQLAFGGSGGIIRVDPTTGVRSTVSENATPPGGPSFHNPGDLVYHCGAILITDMGAAGSALRVDPVTGARTTVSDNASPGQPSFVSNWGIAARTQWSVHPPTPGSGGARTT